MYLKGGAAQKLFVDLGQLPRHHHRPRPQYLPDGLERLHNPVRGFEEDERRLLLGQTLEQPGARSRPGRQKPSKVKCVGRQTRSRQRRHDRRRAWHRLDRNPELEGGLHQPVSGIGKKGHAGIRYERDRLPATQPFGQCPALRRFVVLVVARGRRLDAIVFEQFARLPRVFTGDPVSLAEHPDRPIGDVFQVPDGCGHYVEQAGHGYAPLLCRAPA